ncbi:MAG: glycosyltransferase family 4 protein [Lachnospiraceae bacterium]|nr:glycosyltransferase family 4 protein [Lachnospiraceae bacterium]
MRVLWLVNLILPAYAEAKGLPHSEREGWLSGLYRAVRNEAPENIELAVAFPLPADASLPACDEWDGTRWYGFHEDLTHPERYDAHMEEEFAGILADFRPDIVHVFGTEFPHTLACLKALKDPARALIGIQGLCRGIAENYMAGIPAKVQKEVTFRDLVRGDSLAKQQEKFRKRAARETGALLMAGHLTGRTDYDRKCTTAINPAAVYHPMNETLRAEFYEGQWNRAEAQPHRIFLSQGDYPLKGFHYVLQAMPALLKDYPDTRLIVAGQSVIGGDGRRIPLFLRIGAYGKYLRKLITELNLWEHVEMAGRLDAARMKEEYLRASVFVCPSEIENSPNSLGEAMLLGTPVVASRTGGIPSLLADGREGILTEPGDIEALAHAIRQTWEEPVITDVYCENARKRARVTHDPATNLNTLLAIYGEMT